MPDPGPVFRASTLLVAMLGLAACSGVGPALEILDSRYRDFKYFSLSDVVADNASSSHVVLPGR